MIDISNDIVFPLLAIVQLIPMETRELVIFLSPPSPSASVHVDSKVSTVCK